MIAGIWPRPALIERNNFVFKSLSCWSYNIAVGCAHACRFCYVPDASTNKLAPKLAKHGVRDPDAEWGQYVLLREWDERAFRASLAKAQKTPAENLNPDGNRAVMLCTTTDPYQTISRHENSKGELVEGVSLMPVNYHCRDLVRFALRIIRDESNLNVRILTRSPLARADFDLMKSFGPRLLFGMSLPTLDNKLARIYEPNAPAPSQRLKTLEEAKAAGLHIYVAVAPVYPECDLKDMAITLKAINRLDPVTIFMEPINIRAQNVERIEAHAKSLGVTLRTEVFKTRESWALYALNQLLDFSSLCRALKISESVVHLWPDKTLKGHAGRISVNGVEWLEKQWKKISAWPK